MRCIRESSAIELKERGRREGFWKVDSETMRVESVTVTISTQELVH